MVYDASAKTLKAYLDNVLELTIPNFDLDAILDLDEGRAWMGITAANGVREDNGNILLHFSVATVPAHPAIQNPEFIPENPSPKPPKISPDCKSVK